METLNSLTSNRPDSLALNDIPDILVATPSKCLSLLQAKVDPGKKIPSFHQRLTDSYVSLDQTISLPSLSLLIIDEADLILSYGHSADVQRLLDPSQGYVPRVGVQGVLMSATMTNDVQALKGLALRNPVSNTSSIMSEMGAQVVSAPSFIGRLDAFGALLFVLLDAVQHAHQRDGQIPCPLCPP